MVLGSEPAAAAPRPCCADCVSPAARRRLFRGGASGVLLAAQRAARFASSPAWARGLQGLEDDWLPNRFDINAASAELDGRIRAFSREFFSALAEASSTPAQQSFLTAWNAFVHDWRTWFEATWLVARFRRDELLGFRGRFNDLLVWFKRLPEAATAGPGSVTPYADEQTNKGTPSQALAGALKWVALGGAAIAGAIALKSLVGGAVSLHPAALGARFLRRNPRRRRRR